MPQTTSFFFYHHGGNKAKYTSNFNQIAAVDETDVTARNEPSAKSQNEYKFLYCYQLSYLINTKNEILQLTNPFCCDTIFKCVKRRYDY